MNGYVIPLGESIQLAVTAFLPGGGTEDVTARAAGTTYLSTNPGLLTVSEDGLVTGANTRSVAQRGTIAVLNEGNLTTIDFRAVGPPNDFDNDGMPNDFETLFGLNPFVNDANGDLDSDGLANLQEFTLGTLPNNPDTDADGIADGSDGNPLRPDEAPPTVAITRPADGVTLIEGETLTAAAEAADDGLLAGVESFVNGVSFATGTVPPLEFLFTVPFATDSLTFTARATDSSGNFSTASAAVAVTPDPLTAVQGTVVDREGNPVAGAQVSLRLNGLKAEFFDFAAQLRGLPDLTGLAPDLTRTVSAVNFLNPGNALSLDTFGVGLTPDFAARFSGLIQIPAAGVYTFILGVDDGARLTINGAPVVEVVGEGEFAEGTGAVNLPAGALPIIIEYFQAVGDAQLQLSVIRPTDDDETVVPPSDFLQNADTFATVTNAEGRFSLPGVPTILGDIQAEATAVIDGEDARGASAAIQPAAGGVTDLSVVTVATVATMVWGVQPATGDIIMINPASGAVLGRFPAPGTLSPEDTNIGLSIAQGGASLIYQNSDEGSNSATLFRLNPSTGAILSVETGDSFLPDGISYQADGGVDLIYYSHSAFDLHRQRGLSGPTAFFWETGSPQGGLGGDGNGREFGFFTDGFIHEYDPFIDDGRFNSTLPAPAGDVEGLAFDGTFLYVSTASGMLFTLDPDTGQVLNAVAVADGALYGLGARSGRRP